MNNPLRILSISDDDGLRFSRELLLEKDGYATESINSNMALSVSRARHFDIVLICRSVEPQRAMALIEMLRRYNPEIRILSISPLESQSEAGGADLQVPSGPESLLHAIRNFCKLQALVDGCLAASHRG